MATLTELLAVGIEYDSTKGSAILKAMEVRPFLFPLLFSLSSLSPFLFSFLPHVLSVSFLSSFLCHLFRQQTGFAERDVRGRQVTDKLGMHSLQNRKRYIQATCATSGEGLFEGLDWLSANIVV